MENNQNNKTTNYSIPPIEVQMYPKQETKNKKRTFSQNIQPIYFNKIKHRQVIFVALLSTPMGKNSGNYSQTIAEVKTNFNPRET